MGSTGMEINKTIEYYDQNAKKFAEGTISVEFSEIQEVFLGLLPENAMILDFGCGSGRDTKYFLERGYNVEAIDGSASLCKMASEYTGIKVKQMLFQELSETDKYDGIWACASLLHAKKEELPEIFKKMQAAVKNNGILYLSFKYGEFEGERKGRYFTDLTEATAAELVKEVPKLTIERLWITGDCRERRGEERWLNLILRK